MYPNGLSDRDRGELTIVPVEPPPSDDGFSVDPATLHGVAGQIGKAYDDLNTAISQYCGPEQGTPGVFGSEVSAAWTNFNGAWSQEFNVLGLAIQEMIGKVGGAALGYQAADSAAATAAGEIAG